MMAQCMQQEDVADETIQVVWSDTETVDKTIQVECNDIETVDETI